MNTIISAKEAKYKIMYLVDITESEYMILFWDSAIGYCRKAGIPGLIMSETFMKFWEKQWIIRDVCFAHHLDYCKDIDAMNAAEKKQSFTLFHRISPDNIFPNKRIYEQMNNEILFELKTSKP